MPFFNGGPSTIEKGLKDLFLFQIFQNKTKIGGRRMSKMTSKDAQNTHIFLPIVEKVTIEEFDTAVLYNALAIKNSYSFLLENLKLGGRTYSFIGICPSRIVKLFHISKDKTVIEHLDYSMESRIYMNDDYLSFLENELGTLKFETVPDIPDLFASYTGYFCYEMISLWEDIYHHDKKGLKYGNLPLSILTFPRVSLIIDQDNGLSYLVNLVDIQEGNTHKSMSLAKLENELILEEIKKTTNLEKEVKIGATHDSRIKIENHVSKEEFIARVNRAKEYITIGDAFQIVLSQRFSCRTMQEPFEIYKRLRVLNPSPYMFYLNFPEAKIIGTSPEMLVKVEDNRVITRPLGGTRPRGNDISSDEIIERELLNDEKEKAEHIMLVDLARNDLGRVCKTGTVNVTEMFGVEKYSHVMHIYSQVEGLKRDDLNVLDILKSLLPAGTVSGAPKIRAIQIIDEIEDEPREIYGGAVGYIGVNGNMDTSIAIRTLVHRNGELVIQAGAGIVSDSIAENEYWETINKAMAMFKSLRKG